MQVIRWGKWFLVSAVILSIGFHFLNAIGFLITIKYQVEHMNAYESASQASETLSTHQLINTLTFVVAIGSLLGIRMIERRLKSTRV